MQVQDLSYVLNNAHFELDDIKDAKVSFEVFSLDNVFTLINVLSLNKSKEFNGDKLFWANIEPINALYNGKIFDNKISFSVNAPFKVRSIKVRFDNLPLGKLISLTDSDKEINESGCYFDYPEGWRHLSHPLLIFELENKKYLYIRTLDTTVCRKTFFVKKENNKLRVDVVQEKPATKFSESFDMPLVEYGICDSKEEILIKQSEYMEKTYSLKKYEENELVPNWLRNISLVATVHMQAFTGYIFHTYSDVYKDIEKLSKYINPENILVYLAGWEGRYYYKYGDFSADERMGGEEALKGCVSKLHKLGCKVIAMYGMNTANKSLPNISKIYKEAQSQSITGEGIGSVTVDWDGSHHYDFKEFVNLNIAHPLWANELFNQIKENTLKYDFDGVFIDIAASYVNDKKYSLFEGIVDFCNKIRTIKPDFLVAGEGFYDGLLKAFPLFQSGHTDGDLNYHDRLGEEVFTKYAREFAHLCLGDPSRGSSGVHELGTNTIYNVPLRKGIIPTISLVENSIDDTNPRFNEIIKTAVEYKKQFLK